MQDDSHAPGWRGRPRQTGPIVGMYDRDSSRRRAVDEAAAIERFCTVGCAFGAALCIGAAVFVWAEPAAAWIRGLL